MTISAPLYLQSSRRSTSHIIIIIITMQYSAKQPFKVIQCHNNQKCACCTTSKVQDCKWSTATAILTLTLLDIWWLHGWKSQLFSSPSHYTLSLLANNWQINVAAKTTVHLTLRDMVTSMPKCTTSLKPTLITHLHNSGERLSHFWMNLPTSSFNAAALTLTCRS